MTHVLKLQIKLAWCISMLQRSTHALVYWLLIIEISWPIINLHGLDFQNEWFVSSVAYVIGLSVNTFFIFQIFGIEIFEIWQCEHIEGSIEVSFQTHFYNLFEFIATKSIQKSISSIP
jgi:hypothetical protein